MDLPLPTLGRGDVQRCDDHTWSRPVAGVPGLIPPGPHPRRHPLPHPPDPLPLFFLCLPLSLSLPLSLTLSLSLSLYIYIYLSIHNIYIYIYMCLYIYISTSISHTQHNTTQHDKRHTLSPPARTRGEKRVRATREVIAGFWGMHVGGQPLGTVWEKRWRTFGVSPVCGNRSGHLY